MSAIRQANVGTSGSPRCLPALRCVATVAHGHHAVRSPRHTWVPPDSELASRRYPPRHLCMEGSGSCRSQTCDLSVIGTGACVISRHLAEFGQQLSLYRDQFLNSFSFACAASGGGHYPAASLGAQEIWQEGAGWFSEPGQEACGAALAASSPDQAPNALAGSR